MANDIKQRIVLEGEKEYSSALKEAQRNLRVLRSELKAETAELGKNATEQQKNEVRLKNIQKQIREQEKVVRTYENALKEVREKYGDNEEAIARWEIKLNDARTALANMRNSLNDVGEGMKSVSTSADMGVVAANSFADSLGKVADAGSAISGAIEDAFTGIVGTIRNTIETVWNSVVDLAARSNNLVDLAGFWNTDVTTIQKYKGAVAEASGSLEDLNAIVTKINAGDAKKIAELTGVSGENYSDQWQYAMAVMDAMSKMSKEQRNAAGFELFGGKQATKAFDLLNDWATVQANLDKYDVTKGGYGLTEEQLQNMSDLYDKVNGLKESWESLKNMAKVELFGDLALNITGNLQAIVDAFKEYFQAEDKAGRDAALAKIKENIIEIFRNVKQAIEDGLKLLDELAEELKNSDDATARALGDALDKLVGVLEWFTKPENWDAVKRGFEMLFLVFVGGKAMSALATLASIVAHITTIRNFHMPVLGNNGANQPTTVPPQNQQPTTPPADAGGTDYSGTGWLLGTLVPKVAVAAAVAGEGALAAGSLFGLYKAFKGFAFGVEDDPEVDENERLMREDIMAHGGGYFDPEEEKRWEEADRRNRERLERMRRNRESLDNPETVTFWDKITNRLQEVLNGPSMWWDVPADSWNNGGGSGGLTSEDISGFRGVPGMMKAAVREGVSGIRVTLDGYTVGNLVAPYVSQRIAAEMV